jgi:hypothetical protein
VNVFWSCIHEPLTHYLVDFLIAGYLYLPLHSAVSLQPLIHYFILLFNCVIYLHFATLKRHHYFLYRQFIIFFSVYDFDFFVWRQFHVQFSHDAKINWSVCWNFCYWNVWTFPWVGTVILIPSSLSLSLHSVIE